MLKLKLCILFFGLVSMHAWSQNIRYEGKVTDSIGVPIIAANIIAMDAIEGGMDAFGISNESGAFRLNLKAEKSYRIKISAIGYQPLDLAFFAKTDTRTNLTLETYVESLDEVEVTYEMPVSIKGDTIIYNADSFSTGTEKKLGDILENLPGVEIDADGQVKVEGKNISKVMVEGKDFFDGDSKLAIENIPADVVSKVEVLRNFNEVDQMRNLMNNEDNIAMNIKLKEGKKKFWFGEVGGGLGPDKRYLTNPKLFYYSPKYSLNLIGNTNNLGKNPLTFRDYLNFSGGINNLLQGDGTTIRIDNGSFGFSSFLSQQAAATKTALGAFNFSYAPTEKLSFSGFAIEAGNQTTLDAFGSKNYFTTQVQEQTNTITELKDRNRLFKLSSSFAPNTNFQWDYDFFFKNGEIEQTTELRSKAVVEENIRTRNTDRPMSLNQNMNFYYSINERHVLSAATQFELNKEKPFYQLIRSRAAFSSLLPVIPDQELLNINQNQLTKTQQWRIKMDYYYVLNKKSNLNLTVSASGNRQNFNSEIFQVLDDNQTFNFNNSATQNDAVFDIKNNYVGLAYRLVKGDFKFNTGVTLHQYTTYDNQLNTLLKTNITSLLPKMQMSYNFKNSEQLRFNFRMSNEFSDIKTRAQGYIFNSYNSFYQGNRNLENAQYENYSLSYTNFNMFSFTNIMATLSYNKKRKDFKNSVEIVGIDQRTTTINSNFVDHVYSFNGYFQKSFLKLKYQFRPALSYSKLNNIINQENALSTSFTQNYETSLSTNFKDAPNVELGYELALNKYTLGNRTDTFINNKPFVKFDTQLLKDFILIANYNYNKYQNNAQVLNSYADMRAELSYQKESSPWEMNLEVTNLTNNTGINRDQFNEFQSSTTTYRIQPRFFLFSVVYNL